MDPSYLNLDPEERTNKIMALFSVLLGIGSICGGLIPIAGIIAAALGVLTGFFGRKSESRKLATVGIIISALGMTVSAVYAFFLYISY
jgi:hypothetical protein